MKKIYLLLTFVLFQVLSKAQSDFIVAEEEGTLYINHRVMDQETLTDIATYYSLRQSALEKMNGISADKPLKIGQEIKIPLTETNYYKGFESKNRPEYEALKYFIGSSENLQRIAQHLFLEERFLKNWNPQSGFRRGDLITVGWIKIVGMKQPVNISKPNEVNGQVTPIKKAVPSKGQNGQKTNKPAETKMAQPRVVKNDPNRTTGKQRKSLREKWDEWFPRKEASDDRGPKAPSNRNTEQTEKKESEVASETKKPKKSFKQIWDELVNGKPKNTTSAQRQSPPKPNNPTISNRAAEKKATNNPAVKNKPNSDTIQVSAKKKKSFSQIWDELVNGKPKNSVSTPKRAQTPPVSTKQQASNNNQFVEAKNKPAQSEPKLEKEKKTPAQAKQKKSLKERWNQLVNGETKTPSPEKKKNNSASKPIVAKKEKLSEQRVEKQKEAVSENKQQENIPTEATENKQEEIVDDPFAEAAAEIKKEKSLSSEVKQLKFNAQKNGKAAYFFSGPIGGKFYVVTNLVAKGELVKVVNIANGKYVIAEVIGTLPGNDLTKGLILKISDNAKLPLGQKNSVFNVQIFY